MRELKSKPCPFGQVVVAVREEQGVSRYRLARILGRTPQQLAKLERGEHEPALSTIVTVARALQVDPCLLFLRTVELMPEDVSDVRRSDPGDTDVSRTH